MKIGIDVRYLSHGIMGGVRNYVAHFVSSLVEIAGAHELVLYADTKVPFELDAQKFPSNVTLRLLPYHNALSSLQLDFGLGRVMAQDRIEVAHFPGNYGFAPKHIRTIITLHDAINVMPLRRIIGDGGSRRSPRWIAMMAYLHFCSTQAVKRADLLLTVSDHARQDIARTSRFDLARIVAVPHAPTQDMRRMSLSNAEDRQTLEAVRAKYELPPHFVVADGLKNPAVLVRAWRLLSPALRQNRKLVFFSRHEPLRVVREAVQEGIALLLNRPPRKDLVALYNMADAFAFPSWFEGFGIPVLEAMACGAPVIASDRYSIPEVVGNAGLVADAEDEHGFARHLTAVLSSEVETHRLRQLGFARAAQFSWRDTAQRILHCYEQVGQMKSASTTPLPSRSAV